MEIDGASTPKNINLANPIGFQTNEWAMVIKSEKELELEKIWDNDSFFGKK